MAEQIYHLNEQGQLAPMGEEPFELEDKLQELVAEHPGLLSGEQMNPDNPRRFILVGREQGIADIIGGSNRWSLDHLLIDQDAIPTLVEAKRSSNSQIRREIVGQMMDYAAHATQTWSAAEIRQAFEERAADPNAELAKLLGEEADAEEFWLKVETNLRAKHLRLLFVADGIPEELTRVVEFLNEQMPGIEVLAVEIKQFKGVSGTTLVPRVIGRTSEAIAAGNRSPAIGRGRQGFVDAFLDPQLKDSLDRLLEVARENNAGFNWGPSRVSIRARCPAWPTFLSVAWLSKPSRAGWAGKEGFFFGAGNFSSEFFERLPNDLNELLNGWVNQFSDDDFSSFIEVTGIKAYAIDHKDVAANIDLLCERLDRVLRELAALQPEGD